MTVRFGHKSGLSAVLQGLFALWLAVFPIMAATPSSPAALPALPIAPVEENQEEEKSAEVRTAIEWVAPSRGDRRTVEAASHLILLPVPRRTPTRLTFLPRPASTDPFRNGLGTPYLC